MKFTFNLCSAILLLVATTLEARHHRSHRKRDHNVHIEIYYPKGMMVWYPKQHNMSGFGIEISLNQKHSPDKTNCDICLNTTEITFGKFLIRNENAIIRAGDHLKYRVIKQMNNGSVYNSKSNDFYVADYRILPKIQECSSFNSTIQPYKHQPSSGGFENEIILLEQIIYDVIQHCNNVSQTSKNLFLHSRLDKPLLDAKSLYNHTLKWLKTTIPSMDWDKKLMHAFYYENGIGFEMKTLIDKLKVLQIAKNSVHFAAISDMDDLDHAADEIGSGESYQLSVSDIRVVN